MTMKMVSPMFYDVPCPRDIAPAGPAGPLLHPPRMRYAIFSCPFEAMSYARRNTHLSLNGGPLQVLRREWSKIVFDQTRILDLRDLGK